MKFWLALVLSLPLSAQAVDWGQARLLDGGQDNDGLFWMGFEIELKDGWKTYWQYAGQNGLDPLIELSVDGEPLDAQIHWPKAHLFLADNLPSVGYTERVVIPISFETPKGSTVDFYASLGVCETVCVPVQIDYNFAATGGYSLDQILIREQPVPDDAPFCDWSDEALNALEPEAYWMFVNDTGLIGHSFAEFAEKLDASHMAVYALSEDEVTPLPCP